MVLAVVLRTMTGVVHTLELDSSPVEAEQLYTAAARALTVPPGALDFKLVLRGCTVPHPQAAAGSDSTTAAAAARSSSSSSKPQRVHLAPGEVLLVMPQRRTAPSERLQRAAAEAAGVELPDEDDAALRFSLKPNTPAWERWLARLLQDRLRVPEMALVYLFTLGPTRLLVLGLVLAGAHVASWYNLGPVYILVSILVAIFTAGLGQRQPGDASAYSVFNQGVRRLPGQLDADVLDEQIRRGQM